MNNHPSFETLPAETSPTLLPTPPGVGRDIQFHIKAVYELVNVLLSQVDMLQSDSEVNRDLSCLNLRDEVRRFEIELIQRALLRSRGSQVQAARFLGLNATTLNSKIKRYCLQRSYLIDPDSSELGEANAES